MVEAKRSGCQWEMTSIFHSWETFPLHRWLLPVERSQAVIYSSLWLSWGMLPCKRCCIDHKPSAIVLIWVESRFVLPRGGTFERMMKEGWRLRKQAPTYVPIFSDLHSERGDYRRIISKYDTLKCSKWWLTAKIIEGKINGSNKGKRFPSALFCSYILSN